MEGNRGSCLAGHQSNRLTGSSWTDAANVCVFFAIRIIGNVSPEGKIVNMGVSTAQLMSEAQECFFQKVVKIVFLAWNWKVVSPNKLESSNMNLRRWLWSGLTCNMIEGVHLLKGCKRGLACTHTHTKVASWKSMSYSYGKVLEFFQFFFFFFFLRLCNGHGVYALPSKVECSLRSY